MKEKNKIGIKLLYVLLLCGLTISWILLVCYYFDSYMYRYPTITNLSIFLSHSVVNLLLPLIMILFTIRFYISKRERSTFLLCVLVALTIPTAFMRASGEMLYAPSVCSYTSNLSDFGVYDRSLSQRLGLNPVVCFPESIPEDAQNPQYCYYYSSASEDVVYMAVVWNYESANAFEAQVGELHLDNEALLIDDYEVFLFTDT